MERRGEGRGMEGRGEIPTFTIVALGLSLECGWVILKAKNATKGSQQSLSVGVKLAASASLP